MKLFFFSVLSMATWAATAQQPYQINASLPGVEDGIKVYLTDAYQRNTKGALNDSAVTSHGGFEMKGKAPWGFSRQCTLTIDRHPGVNREKKVIHFFMGDENIHIASPIDSLPGYFYNTGGSMANVLIAGSADEALYQSYKADVKTLSTRLRELHDTYLKVYHVPAIDGVFNTERGIALSREIAAAQKQLNEKRLSFMKAHRQSVVSAVLGMEMITRSNSSLTIAEINEIVAIPDASIAGASLVKELRKVAQDACVVARGVKYTDMPLINKQGKTVQLSSLVKPGQYNMLEFWASWCGPCRAEIPHLKQLHKVVDGKDFNIISISIDEKKADWLKAVGEEKMEWTQLCDPKGWKGPVANKYKILGVPYSVILDKSGKIICSEVRGAELDMVLKDLLGDKITAF